MQFEYNSTDSAQVSGIIHVVDINIVEGIHSCLMIGGLRGRCHWLSLVPHVHLPRQRRPELVCMEHLSFVVLDVDKDLK